MIEKMLVKTGSTVWAQGMMYKAVAQLVLLYGREIWVVMGETIKLPDGFHHRATRWITGMMETRGAGGER